MRRNRKRRKKVSINTYAKMIVTATVFHGMVLTTLSYVLAFYGLDTVTDVSSTIVREIVAPVLTYLITNMVMNVFEKNKMSFSTPLEAIYSASTDDESPDNNNNTVG